MPELPEVETIRKGLSEYLVGHSIISVDILLPRIFHGDKKHILNSHIIRIERFGKGLVISLKNGNALAIHIKMTGQLIYRNTALAILNEKDRVNVPQSFTHIIFHLDNGGELYYNDIRQFGWIRIVKRNELEKISFFHDLGKDILALSEEEFIDLLNQKKTKIKVFLMDQSNMAGIGNIYANDGLFLAKISPKRAANSLTYDESKRLFHALHTVLEKALEAGGSSENDYVNALGSKGEYQKYMLVYNKAGKPCPVCGTILQRITLGGRGTFYCPNCQEE